jgi:CheY-like chemotaxis protein
MDKKYSVLMVDDDKFLLSMYQRKFEQKGIQPELAVGSAEALQKLREGLKPDVLVLDIIMPGMDGLELLETIRKEGLSKDSLVVMLTNESESAKIERAKSLGVTGYIVKATSIPSEVVDEILKIADSHK